MAQVKILAIGNSFSQDATHYLQQIALADGIDVKVVNLYIGGCSLETHWQNIEQDAKLYMYERDGISTESYVSIHEALIEEDWDFVITQQASADSGIEELYFPFATYIFEFMGKYAPKAELLLNQTWAYEIDSTHGCFARYHRNQLEMYKRLLSAYQHVADKLGIRLIPSGDVIQKVRTKEPFIYENGGKSLCRDGFHMDLIYGRYLLSATWYEVLLNKNILENNYVPKTIHAPDEKVELSQLQVIKECVHQIVSY